MSTEPANVATEDTRRRVGEETLWRMIGVLYSRRRFIVAMTTLAAVASVVISLLIPNRYTAGARLLLPGSGSGLNAALLRNLPSAATALLGGGGGGDFMRYLSILTSRSVMQAAVDSFDLVTVYDRTGSQTPVQDAMDDLRTNASFEIDMEYQYLSVALTDEDPKRAADLANFFVRKLNETHARLTSTTAAAYRAYVEKRYLESLATMDSLLNSQRAFQEEYGIYDLPSQAESYFRQVGEMRAQAIAAEIQYDVAQSRLGAGHPQVENLRSLARAANAKVDQALMGRESLMPVPQSQFPEVTRAFASLEMDRTIQVAILEILGPMFEQARLQEEQKSEAVQVVDYAAVPEIKSGPKRSVIVLLATFSVFLLAVVYVLAQSWLKQGGSGLFARLHRAVVLGVPPGS